MTSLKMAEKFLGNFDFKDFKDNISWMLTTQ